MNKLQKQTIQEVIDATRLHEKAIHRIRSLQCHGENLKDIEEGLAISATKLENVIKEAGQDFHKSVVNALTAAVDLIDQYEETRKELCGHSSMTRAFIADVLKIVTKDDL